MTNHAFFTFVTFSRLYLFSYTSQEMTVKIVEMTVKDSHSISPSCTFKPRKLV